MSDKLLKIENKDEVESFLLEYPHPKITVITTIKDGYIACISPVPTIFGPELHCSPATKAGLMQYMDEKLNNKGNE